MLEDSPGYQEIIAIGVAKGISEEICNGMADANRRCIIKLVRHRLGRVPEDLNARLEALSVNELESRVGPGRVSQNTAAVKSVLTPIPCDV
jgi:hypothetical protein